MADTSTSVRVEPGLKEAVRDKSNRDDSTLLDAGAALVNAGIDTKVNRGEPEISGPFGVSRPFSKISFGGRGKSEVRIRVSEDKINRAIEVFNARDKTKALRQAMRLGAIMESEGDVQVEGKAGVTRPFADWEF